MTRQVEQLKAENANAEMKVGLLCCVLIPPVLAAGSNLFGQQFLCVCTSRNLGWYLNAISTLQTARSGQRALFQQLEQRLAGVRRAQQASGIA